MPSRYEKVRYLREKSNEDGGVTSNRQKVVVADMKSTVCVIVTHPWGVLGGNMHNNVVVAAALYFQQQLGVTTIRFDFEGSQIGRGYVQVEQVRRVAEAALRGDFVSNDDQDDGNSSSTTATSQPPKYVLLVGYSYGSLISASASADIPQCIGVVSIAPPFAVQHWLLLFNHRYHMQQASSRNDLPRLFVLGSNDNFTSETQFRTTIAENYPSNGGDNDNDDSSMTTGAILKDADHFFGRRERDLMDVVAEWLVSTYRDKCGSDLRNFRHAEFLT